MSYHHSIAGIISPSAAVRLTQFEAEADLGPVLLLWQRFRRRVLVGDDDAAWRLVSGCVGGHVAAG